MVDQDQHYAGGHYALGLVAEHRGDVSTARAEMIAAARAWSRADSNLPELSRIRAFAPNSDDR
jgi:hypothetical protein